MRPLVSVIIPTYGGGQYLRRTIDSVLRQTYDNVEAIVVDDNGRDSDNQKLTAAIMQEYIDNPKVKYLIHEHNKNGSAARNTGALVSSAEYIALLDDDDEYFPEKIENQVADIEKLSEDFALVYCGQELYSNDITLGLNRKTQSGSLFYEVMMHKVVIGSSSLLIRHSIWNQLQGFDESFRRHQDWEFTARVAYGYKVYAEDFIGYRRYITKRNSPNNPDIARIYREHYLQLMKPYFANLPVRQQRDIEIHNMMDICIQYIKSKRIKEAIKLYWDLKPGIRGIKFILNRLIIIIKRGKLVITK